MYGLNEARQELLNALETVSEEAAQQKSPNGQWSILEILEHLYVTECYMTEQIHNILEHVEDNQQVRVKPMDSVLDRSKKYQAPEVLEPKNIPNSISEALEKLSKSRQSLLEILLKYEDKDFASTPARHLAFGTISIEQWIKFIALHEKRHIDQINEIVR